MRETRCDKCDAVMKPSSSYEPDWFVYEGEFTLLLRLVGKTENRGSSVTHRSPPDVCERCVREIVGRWAEKPTRMG